MQSHPRRLARLRVPLSILLAAGAITFATAGPAAADAPATEAVTAVRARPSSAIPSADATTQSLAAEALGQLDRLDRTGSYRTFLRYAQIRSQIATIVGGELGLDPALFDAAWARADTTHQRALMGAFSQIGVPYRKMREPGVGFDCSGLTSYAWSVAGVEIPRSSGTQINAAASRDAATAVAGDLVYYPGHAMMYLGVPGTMVHAPYPGRSVEVDFISERRIDSVRYGDPA